MIGKTTKGYLRVGRNKPMATKKATAETWLESLKGFG
jgi:hypothetical protein